MAMMALVLAEYAEPGVDIGRVIHMLLLHDLVEIDAGDAFFYDAAAEADKAAREQRSEEHTSELQSLMRTSYAVFCLKKKTIKHTDNKTYNINMTTHK